MKHETYQQQLEYMSYRGLPIAKYTICNTYEEIIDCINLIEECRKTYAYDIDGAVVSLNDLKTRELMGYTIKFPKWSISYKYEAEEATTKLLGIEWNTSRQGKVVPTGLLEPVELGGTTVKRATLNNIDDIERKGVKINSEIFIRRSNDVIPEVMGVVQESLNNSDIQNIIPPSKCPSCGADTEIRKDNTTRYVYCTNTMSCKAQLLKSIDHYCSRQAMNIVGLSEKTIKKFIELGIIKSIADIYILKKDKNKELILKQEGFQLPSYNKLIKAIEESKKCKLPNFIFALGIPNVGIKTAQTLVKFAKGKTPSDTINNILQLNIKDLLKMEDCGDVVANSIYNWFHDKNNIEVLSYLTQMELTFITDKPKEVIVTQQTPFKGKKVYPTGGFNMKKAELKELLESLGAIVETGYKVKLDYLICGHDMSKSSKDKKAMDDNASGKANITILTEDEFLQIIKGN
jgi:DNA ligase (NAD+)